MKFFVDAQLPPGLARWLTEIGHSAQHVAELDLGDAEDAVIWERALDQNAVIVTKDEDFAERHAHFGDGPTVIWLRIGNSTNRTLLLWLEPRWDEIMELLGNGNRLIEVR